MFSRSNLPYVRVRTSSALRKARQKFPLLLRCKIAKRISIKLTPEQMRNISQICKAMIVRRKSWFPLMPCSMSVLQNIVKRSHVQIKSSMNETSAILPARFESSLSYFMKHVIKIIHCLPKRLWQEKKTKLLVWSNRK